MERMSGDAPSAAVRRTLQSLEERRASLQEELAEITKRDFVDVCDYRIIPETEESYAIAAVTSAWHGFQDLLSLTLGASKAGHPLKIARVPADVAEGSRLNFGYAYAGSLGIVLTIRNERFLLWDSELDKAVVAVFGFAKAKTAEQVKSIAEVYGLPVVKTLYDWASVQSKHGIAADVKWLRDGKVTHEVLAQPKEMAALCEVIEEEQPPTIDPLSLVAELTKYDVSRKKFSLELPSGEEISGDFAIDYEVAQKRVPARYKASLEKTTVINFATGVATETWALKSLIDIEQSV
jgi:hypothetical protein